MMPPLSLAGRWVLLTGASSGLGEVMARQLARDYDARLILVARRQARLAALQAELQAAGHDCLVLCADLSKPDAVQQVFAEAVRLAPVHGVILNAGITHFGAQEDLDWAGFRQLLETNVSSVVQLSHLFAPWLAEHQPGGDLLLVGSLAGLVPLPYQAAYSGSKAFVTHFGLSLAEEWRGRKVSFTVFAPGGINTPMTQNSHLRHFRQSPFMQAADACAREGLAAWVARRPLHIPGRLNRLQMLGTRLLPRHWLTRLTELAYRQALKD